ncbi:MAG: glycosyltransferase [Actinobacteria bacterium]|nr:glycosyltransferase [Actinomycetota bacterium]
MPALAYPRPPCAVIITSQDSWAYTKACLESLRPTLAETDQVVVVDDGSLDEAASLKCRYPWVSWLRNASPLGKQKARNQAAWAVAKQHGRSPADTVVLVFADCDTIFAKHWLDQLVAAMNLPGVLAAGPVTDSGPIAQLLPQGSWWPSDHKALRDFGRTWAQSHTGNTRQVDTLGGFCLAVRLESFIEIKGFDEQYPAGPHGEEDLCARLGAPRGGLVVAEASVVHHGGHFPSCYGTVERSHALSEGENVFVRRNGRRSFASRAVFISACLITKNEQANIAPCLASLEGIADEIVIYDTGSTDNTISIAENLGATVYRGGWEDDFSKARNQALAKCSGEWICWVDADEALKAPERTAVLDALSSTPDHVDGYLVSIDNLTGTGASGTFTHTAVRFFRRWRCKWSGALHEQVLVAANSAPPSLVHLQGARILHSGYLDTAMASRSKASRNLRVASSAAGKASKWDAGYSLVNLARSELLAGLYKEAIYHATQALSQSPLPPTARLALSTASESYIALGDIAKALQCAEQLRARSAVPMRADLLAARAHLAANRPELALKLLDAASLSTVDEDGFELDSTTVTASRAEALRQMGRTSEASELLLGSLAHEGLLSSHLSVLVSCLKEAGRSIGEIARHIPVGNSVSSVGLLAQVLQIEPGEADEILEACHAIHPGEISVLATAASCARDLPVERALVWSARLRQAGHEGSCPLIAKAQDPARPPDQRMIASATALRAFDDKRARNLFRRAASELVSDQVDLVAHQITLLCPELVADLLELAR